MSRQSGDEIEEASMTQHTPGPWRQDRDEVYALQTLVAVTQSEPGKQEQRANARLIAAAPEMYALLHRLVEGDARVYAKLSPHAREHFEARRNPNRLADQARALLARIEGRPCQ